MVSFHPDISASFSLLSSCCLYAWATAPAGVNPGGGADSLRPPRTEIGSAVTLPTRRDDDDVAAGRAVSEDLMGWREAEPREVSLELELFVRVSFIEVARGVDVPERALFFRLSTARGFEVTAASFSRSCSRVDGVSDCLGAASRTPGREVDSASALMLRADGRSRKGLEELIARCRRMS